MPSTATDRLSGLSTSVAVKAPCRVATTANITLSGLQTIDSIALADGDRVLVKDQTNTVESGIYVARSGAWERAKDFNGNRDAVRGTMVLVQPGTDSSMWWILTTANPVVIGTSAIVFEVGDPRGLTTVQRELQTATAGQTLFTLSQITYTPGANTLRAYLNGFRITDFTETSANSVTMTSALVEGDEVLFEAGSGLNAGTHSSADVITYTPAGSGAVATTVQDKLRRMVDALDKAADKTGVADSTAAFNALTTDLRAAIVNVDYDYIPFKITIPPGIYSLSSWDLTELLARRVEIHMYGAILVARTAGKHVIDALGSRWVSIHGGVIYSASGVVAKSGIQIGPKGTETCGNNSFHGVSVMGYYSHAAFMNLGSETTTHHACTYINRSTSATAYANYCDGLSNASYLPTSDYATVTRVAGTALSFTANSYNATQCRNEGGGSASYLAQTQGWEFDKACYHLSFNDSAAVVYGTSTYRTAQLTLRGSFESNQNDQPTVGNIGLRYAVTFDNDGTNTAIDGFTFESSNLHAETFVFRNAGAGTLRLSNADIRAHQVQQAGCLMFGTSGSISVDGIVQTQSSSKTNFGVLTAFNGLAQVDDYTALVSAPAAGSYTINSRSNNATYNGGTRTFIEGTFTPATTFATVGDLSVSYSVQSGWYTKIGKLVFIEMALTFTPTYTTASGEFRVSGMPFASANGTNQDNSLCVSNINSAFTWPAGMTSINARIPANSQVIRLIGHGSAAASTAFTATEVPSGGAKSLTVSGCYLAQS